MVYDDHIERGHALRIAFGLTMLVLLLAGGAGAETPISACTTISSPGEYVLTANIIEMSLSSCINITSNDVIFDGAGHTIDGKATTNTYGVYVYNSSTALTNVTVKNLFVKIWFYGIYYGNAGNGRVINNTASGNSHGIELQSSNNNTLTYNTASANGNLGIHLSDSSNNTLTYNTASGSGNLGIHLSESSNNNTLTYNTASGNYFGIELQSSSNNTLISNNANSNANGIIMLSSSNNTIYNNIFNNYNNYQIIGSNTWNTTFQSSPNIIGGFYLGGNFWANPGGTGFSQTCIDDDGDGICDTNYSLNSLNIDYLSLADSTPSTEISSCQNITAAGKYVLTANITNSPYSSCINITSSDVLFDGAGYTIDGKDITNTYGVYVYNSSMALTKVIIKNLIVKDWYNGIYYRNAGNGRIINNTASSNAGVGINLYSASNNNTLTNNTASSNFVGIRLQSSSNNTLANNTASSNSYGIYMVVSSNNILAKNTANSNTDYGISLYSASDNTLTNNTACLNSNNGIDLESASNNNILTNNTANSNTDYGIYLNTASNNILTNNTANSNSYYGIVLNTTSNNTIYNNYFNNTNNSYFTGTIYSNQWNTSKTRGMNMVSGHYLGGNFWASPNGTGFSQTCMDDDGDGICDTNYTLNSKNIDYFPLTDFTPSMEISSCQNITAAGKYVLTANIINSSLSNCIKITTSDVIFDGAGYTIGGTDTTNTYGVYVYNSSIALTKVTVKNLNVKDWYNGIYYKNAGDGRVINDTVSSNSIGISLYLASNNALTNNIASLNSNIGIDLESASNNTLSGNNASKNTLYGIDLTHSDNNTLISNNASNNYYGISLILSSYNKIYDNIFNNINNFFFAIPNINTWNTTLQSSPNILNGSYLGGNFWANPAGTGFSQTCMDADRDGICDLKYTINSLNIDYLPLAVPDTIPPIIMVESPQNTTYTLTDIPLNVSASEAISIWRYSLNGAPNITFVPNTTITSTEGSNNLIVYARDMAGNWNSIRIDFSVDSTPPDSVTNLKNITYASTYINWTWNDSSDEQMSKVMIYLDGVYKNDVNKGVQYYNATGLAPGTYTIGTRTVDTNGNINATMKTHTATTILPAIRFINGTVMDSINKNVLAGVAISTNGASATSNASGFYSLEVASGTYPITATYDIRYYPNSSISVSTELSAVVVQDIELVKKPTGNISGSVTKV